MKAILLGVILFANSLYATMDSNHAVYVLSEHVQSGEYFVQKAPVIGCYGVPKGPELMALTREFNVPSNLGCGGDFTDNINILSCASIYKSVESDDYMNFKEIVLDISNCRDKSKRFTDAVLKVVNLNFKTKRNPAPKVFFIKLARIVF